MRSAARWVAAVMLMTSSRGYAQPSSVGDAFGPGEQSSYRISYLGVTAGSVQVTVGGPLSQWGQAVWPIVATARSNSPVDVYPIRDRFVTYWDDAKQRTVGSDMFIDENRRKRRQRIRLEGSVATVTRQAEGQGETEEQLDVPAATLDMAAATFALRNKPLAVGEEYRFPVFTGRRCFELAATVEGLATVATPLGDREVVRVKVTTQFSGKLTAKRDLVAYFTTDARHVPVRVEAELVLGSVLGELTVYEPGHERGSGG